MPRTFRTRLPGQNAGWEYPGASARLLPGGPLKVWRELRRTCRPVPDQPFGPWRYLTRPLDSTVTWGPGRSS